MLVKSIYIIFKREIKSLFFSPIAYIIMVLYLIATGCFFFLPFFINDRADMRDFFNLVPLILTCIIPAITMRIFSEEYRSGSFEIIATMPVGKWDIVIGKFLSSLALVLLMILPTIIYSFSISLVGDLDWGPIWGGYLGILLLSGAFSAIGLFASSLTHNQIIAFIISLIICFFLSIIFDYIVIFLPSYLGGFIQYLSSTYHFRSIAKGVIDSRDIIYFISVSFIALYATYLVNMEKR